jgi:hypothetical protein
MKYTNSLKISCLKLKCLTTLLPFFGLFFVKAQFAQAFRRAKKTGNIAQD